VGEFTYFSVGGETSPRADTQGAHFVIEGHDSVLLRFNPSRILPGILHGSGLDLGNDVLPQYLLICAYQFLDSRPITVKRSVFSAGTFS
jgi:hypothetical protein